MIRWAGVTTVVVLAALILVLGWIFSDDFIESKLEDLGAAINGARVEIDDLDLSLLEMKITWQRLQATDPKHTMKNMFETGLSSFDLEFWPLLSGKIIIEQFAITDFKTFTDRETDGKIAEDDKPKVAPGFVSNTIDNLSNQVSGNVNMNLDKMRGQVNVDSVMALLEIKSGQKIDSLKKVIEQGYDDWQIKLTEYKIEDKVKEIENKAQAIKLDNVKDLAQVQKSLQSANDIYKDVESVTKQIEDIKTNLGKDIASAYQSAGQVDEWIAQDYARARSRAKLPDISAQNIGKFLFGPGIVGRINQVLGYAAMARSYAAKMKSDKPDKESDPPRMGGQNIHFPSKSNRPDFWLQSLTLNGQTHDGLKLEGQIRDIVSNQNQIGRPTIIEASGGREDGSTLKLNGELNYLKEEPRESFSLSYKNISLNHTRLSDSPLLPTELEKGTGTLAANLNLIGEGIDATIDFTGDQVAFQFKEAKSGSDLNRMIREAIHKINRITINARIKGEKDHLRFNIRSNLDQAITDNIKAVVGAEIDKVKAQIEQRVRQEVDKRRKDLESTLKEREAQLLAEVAKYEKEIDKGRQQVDQKKQEIEKKIDAEKKKLEKGLKEKLKGIF